MSDDVKSIIIANTGTRLDNFGARRHRSYLLMGYKFAINEEFKGVKNKNILMHCIYIPNLYTFIYRSWDYKLYRIYLKVRKLAISHQYQNKTI